MNFKDMNKVAEDNKLFIKDFNDKYIFTALILILPLLMSEAYIGQCDLCQAFIRIMSSWIPGISVMSKESIIPNTVALEISIAWMMVLIIVAINLYRAWWMKIVFLPSVKSFNKSHIFAFFGLMVFLVLELSGYFSFFHGSMGVSRKIHFLLQHEFGIVLLVFFEVIWLPMVLLGLLFMSIEMLKNLGQKIQIINGD